MNSLSPLVHGHHPHGELIQQLEDLAAGHDLTLIPSGLSNTHALPQVVLGPEESGHSLGEFLDFLVHLGGRCLYLVNGGYHPGHPINHGQAGPLVEVQALAGCLPHRWACTVQRPDAANARRSRCLAARTGQRVFR